jgi:hypothetical protein
MQSGKRLTSKDYFAKHSRTHKNHKNTNVELLILSSSVIFRQYGVSQSECKIDRPRPGLSRVSPLVLVRKPWERGSTGLSY